MPDSLMSFCQDQITDDGAVPIVVEVGCKTFMSWAAKVLRDYSNDDSHEPCCSQMVLEPRSLAREIRINSA